MKKSVLFALLSVALLQACSDSGSSSRVNADGLTVEITDLVPQETLDEMKRLGFTIYGGENPPDIENTYRVSPFILLSSNRSSDHEGDRFADYFPSFSNQDNEKLTIIYSYENGRESGEGEGGFVVGEDNGFTVFSEVIARRDDETASFVHVLSGKVTDQGIVDFIYANFMLDDNGDPRNFWIEDGEGRLIYDQDGLSELIDPDEPDGKRIGILGAGSSR